MLLTLAKLAGLLLIFGASVLIVFGIIGKLAKILLNSKIYDAIDPDQGKAWALWLFLTLWVFYQLTELVNKIIPGTYYPGPFLY